MINRFLMVGAMGMMVALAGCGKDDADNGDTSRDDEKKESAEKGDALEGSVFADGVYDHSESGGGGTHYDWEIYSFGKGGEVEWYKYECAMRCFENTKYVSESGKGTYKCKKDGSVVIKIEGREKREGALRDERDGVELRFLENGRYVCFYECEESVGELAEEWEEEHGEHKGMKRVYRSFGTRQKWDRWTMYKVVNESLGMEIEVDAWDISMRLSEGGYIIKRSSPLRNSYGDWRDDVEFVNLLGNQYGVERDAPNVVLCIKDGYIMSPTEVAELRAAGATETRIAVAEGSR